jgi:ribosomal-protein-alanine N-acetyltransferase
MDVVRIETKRLVLREYRMEDWEAVHEYSSDADVARYMVWGPNTQEQTREFVERVVSYQSQDPRTHFELVVELKETGKLVGGIGIRIKDQRTGSADVGYCYHRSVWGKGYGTEAVQAMLKFGFDSLGMHRIWATCAVENKGSAAIMIKNGMQQEGHFRKDQMIKGEWRDTLLYAILEDEWRKTAKEEDVLIRAV